MKKSLVIFMHGGGRLGNQLINFGHFIGWIKENLKRVELVNVAFWDYASLFIGTESNPLCRYPNPVSLSVFWRVAQTLQQNRHIDIVRALRCTRVLRYIFRIQAIDRGYNSMDIGGDEFSEKIMSSRVTLLSGWGLRNWDLFEKHQQTIREFFCPAQRFQSTASSFVRSIRHKYDTLVGVLIREDAYRTWAKGKYFFKTSAYVGWMKDVVNMFDSQRVGFIIVSDENQDEREFQGLNYHMATGEKTGSGHYLENLIELSQCHLVMSPPSTFGAWASFMGAKPLLPLLEQNQRLTTNMILSEHIFDARKHPEFSVSVH